MLTEIYIEALLVDEELADQVWEAWDKGEIDDDIAWLAWWLLAIKYQDVGDMTDEQIWAELESFGIDPKLIHAAPKAKQ